MQGDTVFVGAAAVAPHRAVVARPDDLRGSSVQVCLKAGAVLAAACCFAWTAWAQTIRIPDFRQSPPEPARLKVGEACQNCGRILAIREVETARRPEVPQAFRGGGPGSPETAQVNRVGAVIYLPLGDQTSEKPFVGGVGTPEMRARFQETTYEITVRMDDGATQFIQRRDGTRFRVGDRVRLPGAGQLELMVE